MNNYHAQGQPNALDHYYGIRRQLQRDIQATNAQIRMLNSRIVKSDYDHTQLRKLEQRNQQLLEKQHELEDAIRNQEYMHQQLQIQKSNESSLKHSLGSQYVQLAEDKRRRVQEQRRRAIEQERLMHEYNRRALEEDQLRKKQAIEQQKRQAMEELAIRQQIKLREKEEKEREKEEYNKKVLLRNQIQTQKDSVYKHYYNQFMENQDTLQNIYRNKAAVSEREREVRRSEFEKKEIEDFQQRVAREQEERVQRMNEERDMLRSFLQNQIEEKHRRKSREREEELNYQAQVSRYQMNAAEAEQMQRARRRQQQRRYDQQLKVQTRSKAFSNGEGPPEARKSHNPITNPIDFKIGITNPYLIREYEKEKEKYLGQQLKLRNLALLGNATLHHH